MYYFFKILIYFFNRLPLSWRISFFANLLSVLRFVSRDFQKTPLVNLKIAFPDLTEEQHKKILEDSYRVWGRCLVDVLRQSELTDQWFLDNIDCPDLGKLKELKAANPDRPFLILTGHYGSFEFILRYLSINFGPMAFVARALQPPSLDRWWNEQRQGAGNVLIPRKGAIRKMMTLLQKGMDVGILYDQNIVRSQAIFINWFGRYAATTPAVGLMANKFKLPAVNFTIAYVENRYQMKIKIFDFDDLYKDPAQSDHLKIYKITEACALDLQDRIREYPEQWFWFHRRWKTAILSDQGEKLYREA